MLKFAVAFFFISVAGAADAAACLQMPAPSNTVTSLYGYRYHPVYKRWRLHKGVDLRAPMGTQLAATHAGVVQVTSSLGGGTEIRIVGDGMVTRYLHLTRPLVRPGTTVSAGQPVALSGNTGHASAAPHLHLEAYPQGRKGDVNPERLFCSPPQRKPGADTVNGFPILECSPDAAQCDSAGGPPPVTDGQPSQPAVDDLPPGPTISQFDDMSTAEIFEAEVSRRFSNPDWYRELATLDSKPLRTEQSHMIALRQYIQYHNRLAEERVEGLIAILTAKKAKRDSETRQEQVRDAALRSSGK
ncbi:MULTISPECIES: M23 family metallopeptidase [Aeromonas]|uniref:M23 family metallopeptidase n=1 Tax=Aeromonas TaxID=642 RepID=UPI0018F234DA|nr:M23 family metallopeptidase [Aeromonas veronii]MBJ7591527.1 M23 family metallopeptidase [Aeromonas veronii]